MRRNSFAPVSAADAPTCCLLQQPMPGVVTDFVELEVYQEAREVSRRIFEVSKCFPPEECYSLVDQFRRASRSIGAQIAEAWGKRQYPRHFLAKLSDADAEQLETRHWLEVAVDCRYLNSEDAASLACQLDSIGRMLNVLMQKAESFRTHR